MKRIYGYLFALVAVLFAACSDDDNMNTANVTVSFSSSEVEFKESDNIVNIPLVVTGERNGDIKVRLKVTDGSAISEGHYIVTSTDINIPVSSEDTEFNVEVLLIDDGTEENDDRNFTLAIESIDGATVGANGTVNVILKDVDKNPYFKLFGTWTLKGINVATGAEESFTVTISDYDGYDSYAEDYLICQGFVEGSGNSYANDICWALAYNKNAGTLTVDNNDPYWYAAYNFGSFLGACAVGTYTTQGRLGSEPLVATFNDTFDRIVFDTESPNPCLAVMVNIYSTSTGVTDEYAGRYSTPIAYITMEKQ